MANREVIEGTQTQGATEEIQYRIAVTPAAVSVVGVTVRDVTTGQDVTATVMPTGTATVNSGTITLPILKALTNGHQYEVSVLYSDGVSKIEPVIRIVCA